MYGFKTTKLTKVTHNLKNFLTLMPIKKFINKQKLALYHILKIAVYLNFKKSILFVFIFIIFTGTVSDLFSVIIFLIHQQN